MKKRVLISGGSGLVGQALTRKLQLKGYEVALLSRSSSHGKIRTFQWNIAEGTIDAEAISFADIIIHLAGENISARRWTAKQKEQILNSRVQSTRLLHRAIAESDKKPLAFLSASAVGYYGSITSQHIFKEGDAAGNDFLAQVVLKWEEEVKRISDLGIPTAALRTSVVMSKLGGALPKMLQPVNFGIGSALGTGKQWVPWISLNDLVRMFVFVLEKKLLESVKKEFLVYNAACPTHLANHQLMKQLAATLKKPFFMPAVPAFVFKLLFGEMSNILLEGSRVSSEKILEDGFEFEDMQIADVLR